MPHQQDLRWSALKNRDAQADGSFYYGVVTTGVYCKPSCSSRRPRWENVRFFDNPPQAEQAGFRPCKRCQPGGSGRPDTRVDRVRMLCQWIDSRDRPPSLQELASQASLSPFYLHRIFKDVTGLTPRQYAAGLRGHRLRNQLGQGATVTEALYASGYGSSSSFYQDAPEQLGMQPEQFRRQGELSALQYVVVPCWLGLMLVARSERGLCALLLGEQEPALIHDLRLRFSRAHLSPGDDAFREEVTGLTQWLENPNREMGWPLDLQGSTFQIRVWQALQSIRPGETLSYSQLAGRLGMPRSARAVARACASNPLAVVIPCHRVVAQDGSLTGYRWGLQRKAALLQREAGES